MLKDEKYIDKIKENFARITNILNGLEKAKEVRLIKLEIGYDFKFSEETEDLGFKEGEISMGKDITPEFISALDHTIRNPLTIVMGRAGNIKSEEGKKILEASVQIEKKISEITKPSPNDPQEIKMTTDIEGNTTITPLYPFS
jgi:signal transduction histidine kinase